MISATRPPRYRDSGATLRRFELRGEPREYGLTPGSFRRETERWARVERRKGGKGEKTRSEGTNRQEGTRNRASLFSLFIFYFSKEPYARRMRTPRSPIPRNSINMAPLNNGALDTPGVPGETHDMRLLPCSLEIRDESREERRSQNEQKENAN